MISRFTLNHQRWEVAAVLAYLFANAAIWVAHSIIRPLWYDEIFTFHLAQSGSPLDLWENLRVGTDLNPPLSYLLAKLSLLVFGPADWVIRLPSILGGVLCGWCVYRFVRQHQSIAEAWLAMGLVFLSTEVWYFFVEARPYGLMCGLAALALRCRQRAADPSEARPRFWIACFGLAMFLGMFTHYYFSLVVTMLGVAELVRIYGERRIRGLIIAAFAMPVLALALCYPLWSNAMTSYSNGFWAKMTFTPESLQIVYAQFFPAVVVAVWVLLLLIGLIGRLLLHPMPKNDLLGYQRPERAAILTLAALPVLGLFVGTVLLPGFVWRYILPAIIGIAPLGAWGLRFLSRGAPGPMRLAAILTTLAGFALTIPAFGKLQDRVNEVEPLRVFLDEHVGENEVVMGNPLFFLQQNYYRAETCSRPLFPADREEALKYEYPDTADRGLFALQKLTPVPTLTAAEILAKVERHETIFYFQVRDEWPARYLRDHGATFEPIATFRSGTLYMMRCH